MDKKTERAMEAEVLWGYAGLRLRVQDLGPKP